MLLLCSPRLHLFHQKLYYSFSRFLKHISWNYASFLRTSKHESITSNSIPQTSYIQVKMKLSTQNNSILLKKTNFALRHDTQTVKNTHTTTQFHTLMRSIQNNTTKTVISVVLPKCFIPQFNVLLEYSAIQQTSTKIIILPQHPFFSLGQAKEPLQHHRLYWPWPGSGGKILLHAWCPCVIVHKQHRQNA